MNALRNQQFTDLLNDFLYLSFSFYGVSIWVDAESDYTYFLNEIILRCTFENVPTL